MEYEEQKRSFSYQGVEFDVYLDKREQLISRTLISTKTWEPYQLDLYGKLVPKNGIFIDIGANVGINSIFLSKKIEQTKIFAIEPHPINFNLLKKNISLSGSAIVCINKAVSYNNNTVRIKGCSTHARISIEEQCPYGSLA